MITTQYNLRVIYADTDMMGIVYYGKYFEYFEAARSHMLRELGIPYSEIEKNRLYLPVIESHCTYLNTATFEDILTIICIVSELPKSRFRINYKVYKQGLEKEIATGYTVHSFVNVNGKPVKPPKFFIDTLKENWEKSGN